MSRLDVKRRTPALTGNVVYNWFTHPCPYRVHLDLHPTPPERTPPGATGRYLMERGNRHEARVFDDLKRRFPDDWAAAEGADDTDDREAEMRRRAERTLELMRAGVKWILHGFLHSGDGEVEHVGPTGERLASDLVFRGETDILMREDVPSELGDWSYVVGDVKSSRHAKLPQKMQVAFYSRLLGRLQGRVPERGFIVTGGGEHEEFAVDELLWTLDLFLEEEVHEYRDASTAFYHLEPSCRFCHWRDHCSGRAEKENDLSLIPGARRSEKRALVAAGVPDRAALLARNDAELRALGRRHGRRLDGFRDLRRAASAQEFGRAMVRQHPADSSSRAWGSMTAPDLWAHRGPFLLVASICDHYRADEAAMATAMVRPDEVRAGTASLDALELFLAAPEHAAGEALRFLWLRCTHAEKLLRRRNERAVVVFCDRGLPWRLRRQGEALAAATPVAATWTERLLADSVVLPRFIERALFLPRPARDVAEMAAAVTPPAEARPRRSVFECAELASAVDALEGLAADHGIGAAELRADPDLRPMFVKQWRETGDRTWADMMRFELESDLDAAVACLRHVLRLPR